MHHIFYIFGDATKISWAIQTDDVLSHQSREHVEIYKNKVTNVQSKYIALHVGLFWGIGVFIIKNEDLIKIRLDDKSMYNQLTNDLIVDDYLIEKRIQFFKQLIAQRKLKIEFELIDSNHNLAKKNI